MKRFNKRIVVTTTAIALVAAIGVSSYVVFNQKKPEVTAPVAKAPTGTFVDKMSFNKSELNLKVGQEATLKTKITPANAANNDIDWTSSNGNVASVYEGNVKAQGTGTANITATADNGATTDCVVNVKGSSINTTQTAAKAVKISYKNTTTLAAKKVVKKPVKKPAKKPAHHSTVIDANYFTQANYNKDIKNKYKTIGTTAVAVAPSCGCGYINVLTTGSVQKYVGEDLTVKVYKNGKIDKPQCGYCGDIGKGDKTETINFGVDTYMRGHLYWATPETYRIECYAGGHKFCTVTFKINEQGFC